MTPLLLVSLAARAVEPVPYDELKTAFVERFARHVEWPADALPSDAPFVACVVGEDPIAGQLEALGSARPVKERTLVVRRLGPAEVPDGCHLVWIAPGAWRQADDVVAAARGRPVLLLGDTEGFAEQGVHIELWLDRGQVRFDVNLDAARASGLEVSSQLLRYARIVAPADTP